MSDDPYEKKNLAAKERAIVKKMIGLLKDYEKIVAPVPVLKSYIKRDKTKGG